VSAEGERDAMLASLRLLPDAQAEVVVLAFYGELSHSEIAVRLNLPKGTVKGRMRLGLEKLRLEMATTE
jgi:RNA polymerase sigma-70 factor, ECF subfamily